MEMEDGMPERGFWRFDGLTGLGYTYFSGVRQSFTLMKE